MAKKKKAPKRKVAKKAPKKKAASKKCYIKKTGKSWTAYNMAHKKLCGSTKSREALKSKCLDMGYKAIPFKSNPK
jgi:hypothetical protein